MDANKRAASPEGAVVAVKRAKMELAVAGPPTPDGPRRTSSLDAPIMQLSGHDGAVFSMKFNPRGDVVASGSFDKFVYLWNVRGECDNFMMLKGHKNAILELHWTPDGERLLTASPDKSVRAWDAQTGLQVKKMSEHENFVNSCCPLKRGPPLLVTGSDDGTAKLWDLRVKRSVRTFNENYQVLSVAFSDGGDAIYAAGIENIIKVWDLRKEEVVMSLKGHSDTVTGMRLSPDGTHLLSNSMDNTLRIWDMRPYAPEQRCTKVLTGHQHTFEKNLLKCDWSPNGKKVTAGSGDKMVCIWDVDSCRLEYRLPGHTGSVNEAVFHPTEPIIGSCGSDKEIFLGELNL
uniref:Anaphase-promoting complex subunit 4 WD40 domain-containing protein n=1 Tax=Tetraselmis chuii TaxID=63592 RepID=A0A7S1SP09_9CHLO|mmetsp:Transcript_21510/g.38306  ORF Transcript_21510/g.38306 Transcript_21510/m.38306 type:complete len:345 (+) Transcript_21510:232-1266(+)